MPYEPTTWKDTKNGPATQLPQSPAAVEQKGSATRQSSMMYDQPLPVRHWKSRRTAPPNDSKFRTSLICSWRVTNAKRWMPTTE